MAAIDPNEGNSRENLSRGRTFGELSRVAWRRRKAQKAEKRNREWTRIDTKKGNPLMKTDSRT
jgi:hypothetical protein